MSPTLSAAVLFLAPPLAGVGAGVILAPRPAPRLARTDLLAPLGLTIQFVALPFGAQLYLGYAILAAWLVLRIGGAASVLERLAVRLIALGGALNAAAIVANGKMPYDPAYAGRGDGLKGEPITAATHLTGLADTIPFAGRVISLGDIVLAAGVTLLVAVIVSATRYAAHESTEPVGVSRHPRQGTA